MGTPEIIGTAFIMGFAGSLHCMGMCGPLALSLPVSHRNDMGRLAGGMIYNSGRIFSYTTLGLVFGSAGYLFISPRWQGHVSIALGVIILLYLFTPKKYFAVSSSNVISKPFVKLRQALGKLFQSKKFSSLFFIGILNGLLPCGLVYLALTSSVVTGSTFNGGLFMLFFGVGTFPAMLATVFMGNYLNQRIRHKISKALPVFLFFMAALLILRGMELGIPFVSPAYAVHPSAGAAVSCH